VPPIVMMVREPSLASMGVSTRLIRNPMSLSVPRRRLGRT
jgi:hypothetical protein